MAGESLTLAAGSPQYQLGCRARGLMTFNSSLQASRKMTLATNHIRNDPGKRATPRLRPHRIAPLELERNRGTLDLLLKSLLLASDRRASFHALLWVVQYQRDISRHRAAITMSTMIHRITSNPIEACHHSTLPIFFSAATIVAAADPLHANASIDHRAILSFAALAIKKTRRKVNINDKSASPHHME